jgi:hypothetical protein
MLAPSQNGDTTGDAVIASDKGQKDIYEPPQIARLGLFHVETQTFCVLDKKLGGFDGHTFMGVQAPISNCS